MTASGSTSATQPTLVGTFGYADRLYKTAEIADLLEVAVVKTLCPTCDTYTVVAMGRIIHSDILEDTVTDEMVDVALSLTIEENGEDIVYLEGDQLKGVYYMSLRDAQDFVPCYTAAAKACTHVGPFKTLEALRGASGPVTVLSLACGSGECDHWTHLATGEVAIPEGSREFLVDGEEFQVTLLDSPDHMVVTVSNAPLPSSVACLHS